MKEAAVIIIGAGISGLAAASALKERGVDVILLEARDRFGGRLWTNEGVDIGGQWIHGTEANPLTNLSRSKNVPIIFVGGDSMYVGGWENLEIRHSGGKVASTEEKAQAILLWDEVSNYFDEVRISIMEGNDNDCSFQDLMEHVLKNFATVTPLMKRYLEWQCAGIRDDFATSLKDLSALYWEDGYEVYGYGDSIFAHGYTELLEVLAAGQNIHLNTVVEHVDYSETENHAIKIHTNQGLYKAKKVIVTLPLGVLKKEKVKFTPPLPQSKQKAIQRLGMGTLAKIFLFFDKPFWPEDQYGFGYIAQDPLNGAAQFANLWKTHKIPALVYFVGGEAGKHFENCSENELKERSYQYLQDMFGSDIPQPKKIIRTQWSLDEFAHGSYSFMACGATPEDIINLAKPIHQKLYFAGEATAREFWGNAHAAYLSGLKSAALILRNPAILPSNNFTENRYWREMCMRMSRLLNMKVKDSLLHQTEIDKRIELFKRVGIFVGIPANELRIIAYMFEKRKLKKDEILCDIGEAAGEVFMVFSGSLHIVLKNGQVLRRLPGSVVGEYGLFSKLKRTARIQGGEDDTEILCLDYSRFKYMLLAFPDIMYKLFEHHIQQTNI